MQGKRNLRLCKAYYEMFRGRMRKAGEKEDRGDLRGNKCEKMGEKEQKEPVARLLFNALFTPRM